VSTETETDVETGTESEAEREQKLIDRLAHSGQDTIQRVANELLQNPVIAAALSRAMAAKSRADSVGAGVMAQLNLPTKDDVEALRTRLRTVASRTETLDAKLDDIVARLERIEAKLEKADGA
jgi:hypothetical protein